MANWKITHSTRTKNSYMWATFNFTRGASLFFSMFFNPTLPQSKPFLDPCSNHQSHGGVPKSQATPSHHAVILFSDSRTIPKNPAIDWDTPGLFQPHELCQLASFHGCRLSCHQIRPGFGSSWLGVSQHGCGGIPIAGWFIVGKIILKFG